MTEGVNKEQVNGVEAPIENMVETKCATKSVAWYDIVVILLFFMLSQALGGFVTAFLGVRLPGEAYTTSFDADVLAPDFWEIMLSRALQVRVSCGLHGSTDTNCYRLVHGEGDNLPGLIIDYYDGVCVMQAHSVGMFRAKKQISDALQKVYGPSLKAVYDKSSGTAPYKAGLELIDGYLYQRE